MGHRAQNQTRRKFPRRKGTQKVHIVHHLKIDRPLETQGDVQGEGVKLAEIPGTLKTSGRELPLPQRGSNSATHLDGKYPLLLVGEIPPELSSISITIDLTRCAETDNGSVLGTPSGLFKKTIEGSVKTLDAAPSTPLLSNEVTIATVTVAGTVGAVTSGTGVANAISTWRATNISAAKLELDRQKDAREQDSYNNSDSPETGGNSQDSTRAPDQSSVPATQNTPAQSSTAGGKETPSAVPSNLEPSSTYRKMPTKFSAIASSSASQAPRVTQTAPQLSNQKQKGFTRTLSQAQKMLKTLPGSKQEPATPVSSSIPGPNMTRLKERKEREKILDYNLRQLRATDSSVEAAASRSGNNKSTPSDGLSMEMKGKARDDSAVRNANESVGSKSDVPEPDDVSMRSPSLQKDFLNKHELGETRIEMKDLTPQKKPVEEGQEADAQATFEKTIRSKEPTHNELYHDDDEMAPPNSIESPVVSSDEQPQLPMNGSSDDHLDTFASDLQPHALPSSSTPTVEVDSSPLVEDEHLVEAAVPANSTSHINTQHSHDIDHPLKSEETRTNDSEHGDRDGRSLQESVLTEEPDLYSGEE